MLISLTMSSKNEIVLRKLHVFQRSVSSELQDPKLVLKMPLFCSCFPTSLHSCVLATVTNSMGTESFSRGHQSPAVQLLKNFPAFYGTYKVKLSLYGAWRPIGL
jgi:hypothetical protein